MTRRTIKSICLALAVAGCGSSSTTTTDYAGVYAAMYSGTYAVTGGPSGTNTSSATITISDLTGGEVRATFQLPPNPPSGVIDFALMGSMGTAVGSAAAGSATGGKCFSGIVNGNMQTNCCTACSITFTGKTFTQPNQGTFTGTTAAGVAYSGTYSGVWSGTKE
jgi:hypothetical protein